MLEDYYINEDGNYVFTKEYHLKRGHCCKSGCLHCPYVYKKKIKISEQENENDLEKGEV